MCDIMAVGFLSVRAQSFALLDFGGRSVGLVMRCRRRPRLLDLDLSSDLVLQILCDSRSNEGVSGEQEEAVPIDMEEEEDIEHSEEIAPFQ